MKNLELTVADAREDYGVQPHKIIIPVIIFLCPLLNIDNEMLKV